MTSNVPTIGVTPAPDQQAKGPKGPPAPLPPDRLLEDYEQKFYGLVQMRELIPEVPVQERLCTPVHAYSSRDYGIGEQEYLAQRAAITSGRLGDAQFPAYTGKGGAKTREVGICLCGERHDVSKQTVRRMVLGESSIALYYLGLHPDQRSAYVCGHIREALAKDFPVHYRAWDAMKRALGRIHREDEALPLDRLAQFDPETLRKDSGLLRFIQAIGPEVKGSSLYHVGEPADQRPETYRWKQDKRSKDRTKEERVLSGRFDAIMQRSRREGIAASWKDREEFIKDALAAMPEGADIDQMRLRFLEPAENGFSARTMRWEHRKIKERKVKKADKEEVAFMRGMEVAFRLQDGMELEDAYEEAVKVVK